MSVYVYVRGYGNNIYRLQLANMVSKLKGHTPYAHALGGLNGSLFHILGRNWLLCFKFLFLCAKVCYSATFLISKYTKYPVITLDNLNVITILENLIILLFFYSLHSYRSIWGGLSIQISFCIFIFGENVINIEETMTLVAWYPSYIPLLYYRIDWSYGVHIYTNIDHY